MLSSRVRTLVLHNDVADRLFSRAGKGTMVRMLTGQSFTEDIDVLCSEAELPLEEKPHLSKIYLSTIKPLLDSRHCYLLLYSSSYLSHRR